MSGEDRKTPSTASPAFFSVSLLMQPSDAMIVTSGMMSWACLRISEHAATNTGAYNTSGSPSAIERSTGLKSVSSELICS